MKKILKNRFRADPTFANINLLGKCNANCFFCLGKDLHGISSCNHLSSHFLDWVNFDIFLDECKHASIHKLYLTGQTADGLQYKFLDEIVDYLQDKKQL